MAREISVINANPRPLAVVRVTTVLSEWPRQFMHELDKVYAAVKSGHVRQSGQNVMVYPTATTAKSISNAASRLRSVLNRSTRSYTPRLLRVRQ